MRRVLFVFLISTLAASAQNGGTIESRYGIGELNLLATSRERGMGTVSVPLLSDYDISQSNPAAWTAVDGLRLETGLSFEQVYMSKSSSAVSSGAIKGFQFLVPLQEASRFRLVTGILPVSRSTYTAEGRANLDDEEYTVRYDGNGGLTMLRAGLAARVLPNLGVGASYQYYFGAIEQATELRFDDNKYFVSRQRRATSHSGSGFVFGAVWDGIRGLSIGASVAPAAKLSASRNLLMEFSTHDSTLLGASGSQDIPLLYTVGASWQLSNTVLLAAQYGLQDWTNAVMFDRKQNEAVRAYNLSVGVEWQPSKDVPGLRRHSGISYRFGLMLQQPYIDIEGDQRQEFYLTTGIGFPIFAGNRGDIALEYGNRGTNAGILGTRNVLRLSLAVSVGESWFIRRRD